MALNVPVHVAPVEVVVRLVLCTADVVVVSVVEVLEVDTLVVVVAAFPGTHCE